MHEGAHARTTFPVGKFPYAGGDEGISLYMAIDWTANVVYRAAVIILLTIVLVESRRLALEPIRTADFTLNFSKPTRRSHNQYRYPCMPN